MTLKNATTNIDPSKTAGEIMGLLGAKGAKRISTTYNDDGVLNGMSFVLNTEYGLQEYDLPVRAEGMLAALKRDRNVPASKCTPEHAARVAWRTAKVWLEAQIALTEAGLALMDEVMLPYAIANDGKTMYTLMRENRLKELEQ